jgi:hypothetical protein
MSLGLAVYGSDDDDEGSVQSTSRDTPSLSSTSQAKPALSAASSSGPTTLPKKAEPAAASGAAKANSVLPPPSSRAKQPVQIFVDIGTPLGAESDTDSDNDPDLKRPLKLGNGSHRGSGLVALLPPPKRINAPSKSQTANTKVGWTMRSGSRLSEIGERVPGTSVSDLKSLAVRWGFETAGARFHHVAVRIES